MTSPNPSSSRKAVALRAVITGSTALVALWAGLRLWDHYELEPWTRDGRVRADVAQIAPDVSGLVTALPVADNQHVNAGDLLFEIDPSRFKLALRQAEAALAAQRLTLVQAQRESNRNDTLGNLISQEVKEQASTRVLAAQAAVAQAQIALDGARLNLARAQVRAPVAGTITNLDMQAGSYATAGKPVLALVETSSTYVEGYFEETKLPRIHVGSRVVATTMSGACVDGTVQSIAAGISDRDRSTGSNLLPSVNPTFNWVRLAQRIPVRVRLAPLKDGTRLVSGETATVRVVDEAATAPKSCTRAVSA